MILLIFAVASITSAPAAQPLRISIISDLNGNYGSTEYDPLVHAAVTKLLEIKPDLVLITGDMVAGGSPLLHQSRIQAMWQAFHQAVTLPLQKENIPIAMAPGNHDASVNIQLERNLYIAEWLHLPSLLPFLDQSTYPLQYDFLMNGVYFMALDLTGVGKLKPQQLTQIDGMLKHAPVSTVKILFGHVPLVPFTQGREKEYIGDEDFENLLNQHQVRLLISGHHHAYYPAKRGNMRLLSMGCLGGGQRILIGDTRKSAASLVLMEVSRDEILSLESWTGNKFQERIPRESLPPSVGQGALKLIRDDL